MSPVCPVCKLMCQPIVDITTLLVVVTLLVSISHHVLMINHRDNCSFLFINGNIHPLIMIVCDNFPFLFLGDSL